MPYVLMKVSKLIIITRMGLLRGLITLNSTITCTYVDTVTVSETRNKINLRTHSYTSMRTSKVGITHQDCEYKRLRDIHTYV